MTRIRAFADDDDAFVVWRPSGPIADCRGFAVYRKEPGAQAEIVPTFVGFEGSAAATGGPKFEPSTVWPVQKYSWVDFLASPGQRLRYRVVPMVGPKGALQAFDSEASGWSNEVHLTGGSGNLQAHFNRGIVASQWVARRLGDLPASVMRKKLKTILGTPGNEVRNLLAGGAREAILSFLASASVRADTSIRVALFELDDPEIVEALCRLGSRAEVVLANGAVKKKGLDENADARTRLRDAGVEVVDRMTAPAHLAHNKFAVLIRKGLPREVLTGSTNWSKTGLCTQANNVVVLRDATIAGWYSDYWQRLHDLGSVFPKAPRVENDKRRSTKVASASVAAWFNPVDNLRDMAEARARIDAAKRGILFLMFNPGPSNSLLNAILDRGAPGTTTYDADLFVHGVVNQEPGTAAHAVTLYHRGEVNHLGADVLLPAAIEKKFAYWREELRNYSLAMVHSKVVVVDPTGDHPVVITGSHNLGPKASGKNDENLLIIEGNRALAQTYAVNVTSVYNQYRWRQRVLQGSQWKGLWDNDHWQHDYFEKPEFVIESDFWLS